MQQLKLKRLKAFTLVELIIVITILAILATIAFVSFQNYTKDARDGNRITTLKNIESGLQSIQITSGNYPDPETPTAILSSGVILSNQGYFGDTNTQLIKMNTTPVDPFDQTKYIYSVNGNKTKYQLLTYLEIQNIAYIDQTYAADYSQRAPKVMGDTVGILLDTSNAPVIGNSIDLQLVNSGITYKTLFTNTDIVSLSGYALSSAIYSRQGNAPQNCPDGFIPVPGNAEFSTNGGFCVAKYEMGYADGLIPDSNGGGSDWNTMKYQPGKTIVSKFGVYPIADITQQQAIDACKNMGLGFHLITNNEWMTIARNIEAVKENWSTKTIGNGNLNNGVSNNTILGCTGTGGNIEIRNWATKTGPGVDITCNTKRKHFLINGEEIWDIAGNVWEYVNKDNTIEAFNFSSGQTTINGSSSPSAWDDDGKYNQNDMKKYGSSFGLGSIVGMGNIYYSSGVLNNIFRRGGHATTGSADGIFALDLSGISSYMGRGDGFRCAK